MGKNLNLGGFEKNLHSGQTNQNFFWLQNVYGLHSNVVFSSVFSIE